MKIEDFNLLIKDFRQTGDSQAKLKRIEYTESRGDEDVLANFKSTASTFNLKPLQVIGVFMQKHYSSIVNYIKTGETYSDEKIEERIMDLIQYLELLYAKIMESRLAKIPKQKQVINKETMSLLAKKRGVENE